MAATVGLTATDVFGPGACGGLTLREVELFAEGARERDDWTTGMFAWAQANLMNVHLGRGKRVRAEDLLPRSIRRRRSSDDSAAVLAMTEDPAKRQAAMRARIIEKRDAEDFERFTNSPEGRRLAALLDDEED